MESRLTSLDMAVLAESELQVRRNHTVQSQNLTLLVLEILNKQSSAVDTVREILLIIKRHTGIEAVGIRLKSGEDFPYYETSGFPEQFVKAEMSLCSVDSDGNIERDANGNVCLECMCGEIICGRTNPDYPFFSAGGSFWFNGATNWLASTTDEDRPVHARNRCSSEGYESVALIPLKSGKEIIGLLQLNDRRRDLFTTEDIEFYEALGNSIGVAIDRKKTEEQLRESERRRAAFMDSAGEAFQLVDSEFRIIEINKTALRGLLEDRDDLESKENVIGMNLFDAFPFLKEHGLEKKLQETLKTGQLHSWEGAVTHAKRGAFHYAAQVFKVDDGLGLISTNITKRKQAEEALEQETHDLGERVKELGCLYTVSQLTTDANLSEDKVMQGIVEIIPPSWQYPTITCARIILGKNTYATDNFGESDWKQSADVIVSGKIEGTVEVYYVEEMPELAEGPFLAEERALINALGGTVGLFIERKQAERNLHATNVQLIAEGESLYRSNVALKEVLASIESQKKENLLRVQFNIDQMVLPLVKKIKVGASDNQAGYLELLDVNLREITSPFITKLQAQFAHLSPREVEICKMLVNGMTSKEVAAALNTSAGTVFNQRKTIRKKLGISSDNINLVSFLKTI